MPASPSAISCERKTPHHCPKNKRLDEVKAWAAARGYGACAQDASGTKPAVCATLFKSARFQLWWADCKRSRAVCAALLYVDGAGATQVLYVANMHLEGHPERAAERLVQVRVAGAVMRCVWLLCMQQRACARGVCSPCDLPSH